MYITTVFWGVKRKKTVMRIGDGDSITSHAHLAFIVNPHPPRENFPYGAVIKKRRIKTMMAKPNINQTDKR